MGIIIGLQSATKHAKELKPYSNMAISAALVIEIADTLEAKEKEIENLKAQVEQLRRPLIKLTEVNHENGGSLQPDGQFAYRVKESIFREAKAALDKTPAQCPAEIKAQAIEDAVTYTLNLVNASRTVATNCRPAPSKSSYNIEGVLLVKDYADQLRQSAKGE